MRRNRRTANLSGKATAGQTPGWFTGCVTGAGGCSGKHDCRPWRPMSEPAAEDAARPAPGAGRPHGALRRLRDAGSVQGRHGMVEQRRAAALFDVSHMGQVRLVGRGRCGGAGDAGAGGHHRPAPGRQRWAPSSPTPPAASLDDLMISARGAKDRLRRPVHGGQRRLQGRRHPPPADRHRPPRGVMADARARTVGAAGPEGGG